MQRNYSEKHPSNQIEIEFTDKPITGFGGMVVLARFMEKLKVKSLLHSALPDQRTSPNALPVVDIVTAFFAAVAAGASRFAHIDRLRMDHVIENILDVKRIPSAATLTRYFGSFTQADVEVMSQGLGQWLFNRVKEKKGGYTLDLDSSVFTRYGEQQGAKKGYNPKKPGRLSHHPIFAVIAEKKIIANLWLRSGNTASISGAREFLEETLGKLPKHIKIKAVRADSGFHSQKFFSFLEKRKLNYIVAVRMDQRIQRFIAGAKDWQPFDEHRDITTISYKADTWDKHRAMVVVRERIREGKLNRGKTLKLFDIPAYTYSAVFTNIDDLEPLQVWRMYNQRADMENRLKEFRDDFNATGFCLDSFFGTEAVLRLIAFLFNLIALFKSAILLDTKPTLRTLRYSIITVGAVLGSCGRKKILRISARGKHRQHLKILIERILLLDQTKLQCSWKEA